MLLLLEHFRFGYTALSGKHAIPALSAFMSFIMKTLSEKERRDRSTNRVFAVMKRLGKEKTVFIEQTFGVHLNICK